MENNVKVIQLILILFMISITYGSQIMKVNKTDGTTDKYEILTDVNITFDDITDNDIMKIFKTDNSVYQFNRFNNCLNYIQYLSQEYHIKYI